MCWFAIPLHKRNWEELTVEQFWQPESCFSVSDFAIVETFSVTCPKLSEKKLFLVREKCAYLTR
jgi:hypothetical protein